VIFVDSNIPMYIVGGPHPNKDRAIDLLDKISKERKRLVTSAEVYQEIIHRFSAINRRDGIRPAFEVLDSVADEIFPIEREDVLEAHRVALTYKKLSARDALHVAVMKRYAVSEIMTYDRGFDQVTGISRIIS